MNGCEELRICLLCACCALLKFRSTSSNVIHICSGSSKNMRACLLVDPTKPASFFSLLQCAYAADVDYMRGKCFMRNFVEKLQRRIYREAINIAKYQSNIHTKHVKQRKFIVPLVYGCGGYYAAPISMSWCTQRIRTLPNSWRIFSALTVESSPQNSKCVAIRTVCLRWKDAEVHFKLLLVFISVHICSGHVFEWRCECEREVITLQFAAASIVQIRTWRNAWNWQMLSCVSWIWIWRWVILNKRTLSINYIHTVEFLLNIYFL